jgi:kinesin family protein 2/24
MMFVERLCDSLLADQSSPVLKVSLSAFEMRGGSCYDLLSEPSFAPVKIQGAADDTFVGLSSHDVADAGDLLDLVRKAGSLRTTRSTIKNDTSSRSARTSSYCFAC